MSDAARFVEANGIRFAYHEDGRGPLVLLLHGFPDTARSWDSLRGRLAARGYRAVSPYLRGYAPTQVPDRDTDLPTLGADVAALIPALGETSAIVVGHDWGAAAAYTAAIATPGRISRLVTVAIPHPASLRPSPWRLWSVRHFLAYKRAGAARRFAADDFAAMRALYRRWSPTWDVPDAELAPVRDSLRAPGSLDAAFGYYRQLPLWPPRYLRARITVPTVVFAGRDDRMIRPADYRAAAPWFTAGYVVEELPGGHFLHREHPDAFAERLLAHLPAPGA